MIASLVAIAFLMISYLGRKNGKIILTLRITGMDLATNGVIVNDALRIIRSKINNLNCGDTSSSRLLRDIKQDFNSSSGPEPGLEEEQLKTTSGVF
jgi:hypothetical protein